MNTIRTWEVGAIKGTDLQSIIAKEAAHILRLGPEESIAIALIRYDSTVKYMVPVLTNYGAYDVVARSLPGNHLWIIVKAINTEHKIGESMYSTTLQERR